MTSFKTVRVEHGPGGWGGPLTITPTEERNVIACITGGGIHPVAQTIAELTGAPVVDAFKNPVPPEKMACVVIDCGGTARCGVYPRLGVLTVDVTPTFPSGPLMQYIRTDNFVSGVTPQNVFVLEGPAVGAAPAAAPAAGGSGHEAAGAAGGWAAAVQAAAGPGAGAAAVAGAAVTAGGAGAAAGAGAMPGAAGAAAPASAGAGGFSAAITRIGRSMGGVVGIFYQAGRETVEQVLRNILPFMAFVATLIGIILASGIGEAIANVMTPLAGTLPGLFFISVVCALPFLSPVLGPGAVIAQVIGVLVGVEIGRGNIPPQLALPALFAINPQVGCDFVPVGLTLVEAQPETIEDGVPAVLISRLITGPASVIIAYLFSFGLYA